MIDIGLQPALRLWFLLLPSLLSLLLRTRVLETFPPRLTAIAALDPAHDAQISFLFIAQQQPRR